MRTTQDTQLSDDLSAEQQFIFKAIVKKIEKIEHSAVSDILSNPVRWMMDEQLRWKSWQTMFLGRRKINYWSYQWSGCQIVGLFLGIQMLSSNFMEME